MTEWDNPKTIRVPEHQWSDSKEIRPDGATHGDCLVAGARLLARKSDAGFEGEPLSYLLQLEESGETPTDGGVDTSVTVRPELDQEAVDGMIDELKKELSMAADSTVQPNVADMMEKLDRIESAAKEATQAAQSAERSVEQLQ